MTQMTGQHRGSGLSIQELIYRNFPDISPSMRSAGADEAVRSPPTLNR